MLKPRVLALFLSLIAAVLVAACGESAEEQERTDNDNQPGDLGTVLTSNPDGKRGGTLTILSSGDVDYLDPGKAYYQFTYTIMQNATQRPLYAYKPDQTEEPSPDLADGPPEISDDGRTVTVKMKDGCASRRRSTAR